MSTIPVLEPIFDADVRTVYFFNGRLMTAEDWRREQAAGREERRRLGKALGDGVAYGLEVTPTVGVDRVNAPTITIQAGLAVNRRGQPLYLADPVNLALHETPGTDSAGPVTAFAACQPADADAYVAGAGLYLLTIGWVEGREGRAMVSGLGNIEASCNTRYEAPGVRFRMIQLDLRPSDQNEPARLRNRVVYRCFGGEPPVHEALAANLFGPPVTSYGLIDDLRPTRLTDCEVPLALVYLTADLGLAFVDMWAARRRITQRGDNARFPLFTGQRREAEGEAMLMQFTLQLQDLIAEDSNPAAARAVDHFRYLPPAGLVPLGSNRFPMGFHEDLFFDTISHYPVVHIEGARVEALLRLAQRYPPLDITSGVMLWIYRVRENQQAIDNGTPTTAPQPYVIFATGHMPFMGDPHFDVNHWDYSNFA